MDSSIALECGGKLRATTLWIILVDQIQSAVDASLWRAHSSPGYCTGSFGPADWLGLTWTLLSVEST